MSSTSAVLKHTIAMSSFNSYFPIRDLLPKEVCQPNFLVKLCAKELRVEELDELSSHSCWSALGK